MAINQNHTCEELNGIKCSIAEKNVSKERADFLKELLEFNGYKVIVTESPLPKVAPAKPANTAVSDNSFDTQPASPLPPTFTVGVTDLLFNPINALFGRQLHTHDGHIVTPAYWKQMSKESRDDKPYFG
jgi:hypothetical protein